MRHLVFEHCEDTLTPEKRRVGVILHDGRLERSEDGVVGVRRVLLDDATFRPAADGPVGGSVLVARIDASREQYLQLAVDPGLPEPSLEQAVDAEGGNVTLVEDHRMSQRNRAVVVRLGLEEIEQRVGALAVLEIRVDDRLTVDDSSACRSDAGHVVCLRPPRLGYGRGWSATICVR